MFGKVVWGYYKAESGSLSKGHIIMRNMEDVRANSRENQYQNQSLESG